MDVGSSSEGKNVRKVHIEIPTMPIHDGGHERLASFMGLLPETAIFRRFATLNVKNLLYYQAELAYLERRLKAIAEEDRQSGDKYREQYRQAWYLVSHSEQYPNGSAVQWQIFERIRKVLHDYSQFLLGIY
jgi:hypothetical protein